jgi:hypothetical protein
MTTSNIDVKIIAEFLGKNAFRQAENATGKLTKSVQRLGSAFGLTLGVYGAKAMAKAFIDDSKAAAVLANSLKNVGLSFNTAGAEQFIKAMQDQTTILDDELRPAYGQLAQVTGSVVKTQELMQLAFDASRGSGVDFASTVDILSQAYVGNTKGIKQLNLGLTQAEIKSMTFSQLQEQITSHFKGAGKASLSGYAYEWDNLNVKVADAKELLGKNMLDALASFSGEAGAGGAGKAVEKLAKGVSDTIVGITNLTSNVKVAAPILVAAGVAIMAAWSPWLTAIAGAALIIGKIGNSLPKKDQVPVNNTGKLFFPTSDASISLKIRADQKKAELDAIKRNKQLAQLVKDQAAAAAKALKAKKDAAALDKAALMLAKGQDVFDMDQIQLNAALINQAKLLGNVTNGAQILAIANDVARLNVKKDILDLEAAIAAGDAVAATAAAAKLSADLKVLDALTGQKTQVKAIESILAGLKPKELIDQENLDKALAKIAAMLKALSSFSFPSGGGGGTGGGGGGGGGSNSLAVINKATEDLGGVVSVIGQNGKEFIKLVDGLAPVFQSVEDSGAFNALVNSYASGNINPFNAGSFRTAEGGSLFNSGAVGSRDININVTTGIGDPNAIAEAVNQVIQDAVDRGTLRGGAY